MAPAPQPPRRGSASGGRGVGPGGSAPQRAQREIPSPRIVEYFDRGDVKAPNPKLVGADAETMARSFAEVPASQLRRFYSDVAAFGRKLEAEMNMPPEAIQAQMGLLKAKAVYTVGRGTVRNNDFLQFFVDHAAAVKTRDDFRAFRRAFEAVIAYHKFYEKK